MKTLKQLISFLLLLGIMSNSFNYWLLSTSYSVNKSYIAGVLCSNKNRPEMHCEGKCFMDIKLKELEQKNKSSQNQLKQLIETPAPTFANALAPVFEIHIDVVSTPYLQQKPITPIIEIFQPPKLV